MYVVIVDVGCCMQGLTLVLSASCFLLRASLRKSSAFMFLRGGGSEEGWQGGGGEEGGVEGGGGGEGDSGGRRGRKGDRGGRRGRKGDRGGRRGRKGDRGGRRGRKGDRGGRRGRKGDRGRGRGRKGDRGGRRVEVSKMYTMRPTKHNNVELENVLYLLEGWPLLRDRESSYGPYSSQSEE